MKKIVYFIVLSLVFVSCNKEKDIDFEVGKYIKNSDWKVRIDEKSKDTSYTASNTLPDEGEKKGANISISARSYEQIKLLKKMNVKNEIDNAILELENSCNNPLTFQLESIMVFFLPKSEGMPSKLTISVMGTAKNSFGVPGTVSLINSYDDKTGKKLE
jgi:putative lipoic acid-binding regulatory protein